MGKLIKIIEGRFKGMPAKKTGRKGPAVWVGVYDPENDQRTYVTAGVAIELIKGVVTQYPGKVLRLEYLEDEDGKLHYRDYVSDDKGFFRCCENKSSYYVEGEENIPGLP